MLNFNPISQSVSHPVSTFCSDVSRREKRVRFQTCLKKECKLISDFSEVTSINTELFQKTFPLPIKLEMSGIIFWLHLIPLLNSPALFEVSSIIRRSRSQQFCPRLAVSYENATQSTVHAQAAAQSTEVLLFIKYHFKQKHFF